MIAADLNVAEMGDLLAFTRLYDTCSAVCISTPSAFFFFFFFILVICFIGKTLCKWHLCSPPKIHKHLAGFSHFCAVDKGQITDGNINFHVFSCDWGGGDGGLTGFRSAVECVSAGGGEDNAWIICCNAGCFLCSPETPLVNNTHDISTGSI